MALSYDLAGRLSEIRQGTGALERVVTFGYDALGRLDFVQDPALRTVGFDYDGANRVIRQTLPDLRFIDFDYDLNGNLELLVPPSQPGHVFRYTGLDQEAEYEPPQPVPGGGLDTRTIFTYDLDRALDLVQRPDGTSIDLAYEPGTGRLSSVAIIPGGTITQSYHPTSGNVDAITAPGGEALSFAYDGSLLTATTWAGTVAGTVSQTYDDEFRVDSQTVSGSTTESFVYDDDGLLIAAGAMSLGRDPLNGLLTGTTLGNVTTLQTHNGFGELATDSASVSGTPVYANTYDSGSFPRDKLGRIVREVETIQGTTTTTDYGYDLAGRLETVTVNGVLTRTYAYDGNGNRLSLTEGATVTSGTYDDQDRLLTYGTLSFAYDLAGDLLTRTDSTLPPGQQTTSYTYDALGNLVQVDLPDERIVTYVIDGQNRRVGKKIDGVLVRAWLYQDQLNPVAELDAAGNVVARFVYGSRPNVPDHMVLGGNSYRILSDHLGSVRLVVNSNTGAVAQRLDYDEFGRVTQDTNPGFQPFGFAGGIHDPDTGLVRFGARDYDPVVGRWTTKDPVRFAGGDTNLYGYVVNDPVNLIDPSGEILPLLYAAGTLLAGGAIGIGVPLGIAAALGDECDFQDTQRAAAQATVIVTGTAAIPAAIGGAAQAAPVVGTAALANAGALTQTAQNSMPRLPAAIDRAAGVASSAADAAASALGNLFGGGRGSSGSCGCP